MKAHLQAVGLIDLVAGAFFTVLGLFASVGLLLLSPWFYGAKPWSAADEVTVIAVALFISAVFLVIGIPSLIAGTGLRRQRGWARVPAIVLAVLALTSVPLGTAAGIYTLWVLTQKETEQLLGTAA